MHTQIENTLSFRLFIRNILGLIFSFTFLSCLLALLVVVVTCSCISSFTLKCKEFFKIFITVNVEIFAQYIFSRISRRALDARKI